LSYVPYYEGRASLHLQDFIGGSLSYIRDKIEEETLSLDRGNKKNLNGALMCKPK
jgi:hypothetical protein